MLLSVITGSVNGGGMKRAFINTVIGRSIAGAALFFMAAGCASTHTGPATGSGRTSDGDRFTAGDGMLIVIHTDTGSFLNGTYPIDNQGNVYLPIVGNVQATGQTPAQFSTFLQRTYQQYLRFPEVQAVPLIRVSMLGGFLRPGMYYVEPDRSLWDCVFLAGGTTFEDGLTRMRWERDRAQVANNLIPYIQSGQSLRSIGFRSGDQLWTPSERGKNLWTLVIRDFLVRDILPVTTFLVSIYLATRD
jgi:protein involved in polysaccharide export with SLBB domain